MDGSEECVNLLKRAWSSMRVSVRCPDRLPTWDVILITASSPNQSELYQLQIQRAVERGRIAPCTFVLAVPDPHGKRIGSGGATLFALRQLALRFKEQDLSKKRVLLIHAGGDSKRVPWANAIGKAFIPFPVMAHDDPDEPVTLLFDHILAVSSLVVSQLSLKGGLFIMTGDVLPCFDASRIPFPESGAVVVTVPTSLRVASNHGVILAKLPPRDAVSPECTLVEDLLQKPSSEELYSRGAVGPDSTALLDTGIFLVVGRAWEQLLELSTAEPDPVDSLLKNDEEMSLYEEIAGAWVPARHDWLETRRLGTTLTRKLGTQQLYHYCAYDLTFLHFGTSAEILHHLSCGRVGRRQFSCVESGGVAETSVILASTVESGAAVGERSLVFNSTLSSGYEVGADCIIIGVHDLHGADKMTLPDNHCLWEVPLKNDARVILCCNIKDNPKALASQGGTFCGKVWDDIIEKQGIHEKSLWPDESKPKDFWNAKLFPVLPSGRPTLAFATWLMGAGHSEALLKKWHISQRLSLAELQEYTDFGRLFDEMSHHQAKLATAFAKVSLEDGSINRNFRILAKDIGQAGCNELLSMLTTPEASLPVPASRVHQARADLCSDNTLASFHQESALQAVAAETQAAVCTESRGSSFLRLHPSRSSSVSLPVRLDIVGGWSDTPPWSVEREGRVLNMAVYLNGQAPVGADVLLKKTPGMMLYDDAGNSCFIDEPTSLEAPFDENDPFRLVKAALMVTGWTAEEKRRFYWGLEIRTWSNVPRGSGLGTSSILAAAVVRALLEVSDGNPSDDNVARLVLVLEQLMGTGGGWQDQVGGIYPGLKCTRSLPGQPMTFIVEPVQFSTAFKEELEQRLVLVFTGQVRLANMVLQKVVTRYLQRDSVLISSIQRLVELAKQGQESFAREDLESVGRIMLEAWQIHQELDPFCSNPLVDSMFRRVSHLSHGYKLVGAGGGGFAIIMAKDTTSATNMKRILSAEFGTSLQFYNWTLHVKP